MYPAFISWRKIDKGVKVMKNKITIIIHYTFTLSKWEPPDVAGL